MKRNADDGRPLSDISYTPNVLSMRGFCLLLCFKFRHHGLPFFSLVGLYGQPVAKFWFQLGTLCRLSYNAPNVAQLEVNTMFFVVGSPDVISIMH